MKIDIEKVSYDPRWYNFNTGEIVTEPEGDVPHIKIKPFPFSKSNVMVKDGAILLSGEEQCKVFKESCLEWVNIIGSDDKPLPCTDEVKQIMFDLRIGGISDFVVNKIWEFEQARGVVIKN